jgi:betaine-aldehyde dehydrogenase
MSLCRRSSQRAKSFKLGRGDDENNHIGPSVDEGQFNTVLKYIDIGREDGAEMMCGGKRATGDGLDNGFFVEPTVFDHVTPDMRIAREEIFGPGAVGSRVKDFDEAMRVANDSSSVSHRRSSQTTRISSIDSSMRSSRG